MIKYGLKKICMLCLLLLGITFISFTLIHLSPGDPAQIMLNSQGIKAEDEVVQALREEMGLNDPMLTQYGKWLGKILSGDMGISYKSGRPVIQEITMRLPGTICLTIVALATTMLISIPVGTWCAYREHRLVDRLLGILTFAFASIPSFFLALLLMYFLSLKFKLFPVIGNLSVKGMVMPVLCLALPLSAWYIRQIRVLVLREWKMSYVEGLRARGMGDLQILNRHVLKNCMVPILTLTGISFGTMLGGTTIVESIFSWPGVGKWAIDAISARDYPVIQAYVVWMSVLYLLINFILEMIYPLLDPRIRREGSKQ